MALDADNVRVGLTGNIYMAPKGTAGPTDLATAWPAGWLDLGYMSEDGVSLEYTTQTEDVGAWQSLSPVRKILTGVDMTMGFTAIELKADTVTLFFPGSTLATATGVHTLTIPSAPGPAEFAFGLEWKDGTITNRLTLPRGEVTERGAVTVGRSAAVGLEMTVTAYATSAPELATWLSDDPAWATA
ncbi:phage tail protein [Streptomyces sp. JJ66]|uniref:phage tail tube protein n=1 Tax=Streptomyces sp. JJ66 TaxID=2803843 RepID=UPI001C598C28|nr:phage tail protein [Streptomyces sp. JJ66]MBW1600898.1 phage tail protein [Streptomyces sp. JJ66]